MRTMGRMKSKSVILRYRTVASEETSVEAKTSWLTDIQRESEEESIDCPDCYDTMIKFYDWGNIRYRCENCDLFPKMEYNDSFCFRDNV